MADQKIEMVIGLNLSQAKKATGEYAKNVQKYAEKTRQGVAEREKKAQTQALQHKKKLISERKSIAIKAIEDRGEREKAQAREIYKAKLSNVKALLRAQLEAGEITEAQHERQLKSFRADLTAIRDRKIGGASSMSAGQIRQVGEESHRANLFLTDFSRTIQDLPYGIQGIANNLDPLIGNYQRLSQQAANVTAATGKQTTAFGLLAGSLSGAGGILLLANLATTLYQVTGAGEKVSEMFSKLTGNAKQAREEMEELRKEAKAAADSMIEVTSEVDGIGATLTENEAKELLPKLEEDEQRLARIKESLLRLEKGSGQFSLYDADEIEAIREEVGGGFIKFFRPATIERLESGVSTLKLYREEERAIFNALQGQGLTRDEINDQLGDTQGYMESIRERLDEIADRKEFDNRLSEEGVETTKDGLKATEEQEKAEERYQELARRLQIERIEEGRRRELAEARQTYEERVEIAEAAGKDTTEIEAAYQAEKGRINAKYARQALEEHRQYQEAVLDLQERRRRLDGATQEAILRGRIERIDAALAAERAAERTGTEYYQEMVLERHRAELDLQEEQQRIANEKEQAQEEAADKRASLARERAKIEARVALDALGRQHAQELAAVEGKHERQRLQARQAAEQRRAEIAGWLSERQAQIESEYEEEAQRKEALDNAKLESQRRYTESAAQLEGELTDVTKREMEARRQTAERYARQATDAVFAAFEGQRQISDTDVALQQQRFREREAQLDESLAARDITQREHSLQMRKLAEERAAYEKRVEADRASVIARSVRGLRDVAIDAVKEELKERIAAKVAEVLVHTTSEEAKTAVTLSGVATRAAALAVEIGESLASAAASMVNAVAKAIEWLASTLGPFALAAIPAVAAGAYSAYEGAKALFGFRSGGLTGSGPRDEVAGVVHKGEAVMEKPIVQGQEKEWMVLRKQVQMGVPVSAYLQAIGMPQGSQYASGGLVGGAVRLDLPTMPRGGPSSRGDLSRLERQLARVNASIERLDRNQNDRAGRPTRLESPRRTSRRLSEEANAYDRLKDPRRR